MWSLHGQVMAYLLERFNFFSAVLFLFFSIVFQCTFLHYETISKGPSSCFQKGRALNMFTNIMFASKQRLFFGVQFYIKLLIAEFYTYVTLYSI